jgi:type VI protein secretion system component VasK
MEYYFDNAGIVENLPAQPLNRNLRIGLYVALGACAAFGGVCIWAYHENKRMAKQLQQQAEKKAEDGTMGSNEKV